MSRNLQPYDSRRIACPAMAISRSQGVVRIYRSSEELTTATASAVKNGWFVELDIIDAKERLWTVRSFRVIGGKGPFWGYSLMYGRRLRLELGIDGGGPISVDGAKARVNAVMRVNPDFWASIHGLAGLKEKLAEARSIREVIDLFDAGGW